MTTTALLSAAATKDRVSHHYVITTRTGLSCDYRERTSDYGSEFTLINAHALPFNLIAFAG